jgi:hypothetical protein
METSINKFNLTNIQVAAIGLIITLAFYFIFQDFFTSISMPGENYFPILLDGVFWEHNNGLFAVPWFTPAFGGGLPKFPNPQSVYYSVEQFLCFFTNPVMAIKITLFLFGLIGFYGCYLLLRKVFLVSSLTSLLGASIFLFNGFYIYRMLIGHINFHPFMLYPLFLLLVLRLPIKNDKPDKKKLKSDILLMSLILTYMFYSGAFHIIPPLLLTTAICALLYNLTVNTAFSYKFFILKLSLVLVISISASAAYLNASFSYLHLFPRDLYPLPGIPSLTSLVEICVRSLFGNSPYDLVTKLAVNRMWRIDVHEMEFGVGFLPVLMILAGVPWMINKIRTTQRFSSINALVILKIIALLLLLFIPLLLNYYTPSWNEFLKSIPFFKNSSSNFRWFCCYIPVVIIVACIVYEKATYLSWNYRKFIIPIAILVVIVTSAIKDHSFYRSQHFSPKPVLEAYHDLKAGKLKPEVKYIDEVVFKGQDTIAGGDVLAVGSSQLRPYEPIFGYRLENFPVKSLVAGEAMQVNNDGYLNLKNPASYVFPKENNCEPGDHFKATESDKAEKFRTYKKFPFQISGTQHFANMLSLFSLSALFLSLLGFTSISVASHFVSAANKPIIKKKEITPKKKRKAR